MSPLAWNRPYIFVPPLIGWSRKVFHLMPRLFLHGANLSGS